MEDRKKENKTNWKDLVKSSQENFKAISQQKNEAYTKINQLNSEIEGLKAQITNQKDSITNLEKKSDKVREQYKKEEEEWKKLEKEKNKEIEEKEKNFNDLLERHKTLLCSKDLLNDPDLKKEKSYFLEKLWEQKRKMLMAGGIPKIIKESEKPKVLNFEDYIKSEKCVCGKSKKFSSKGCPTCRKEAEKYSKRDKVGMEKSWERVWNSYGMSMEYP